MIPDRANGAARIIRATLEQRGIKNPALSNFAYTEKNGERWLFAIVDVSAAGRLERYSHPETLHQLQTALRGAPVFISNTNGFRYAVLLSDPPVFPRQIDLPDEHTFDWYRVGVDINGIEAFTEFAELGHVLVAGKTGAGKSYTLASLAYQAALSGCKLLISDANRTTFPMFHGSPVLAGPMAVTADESLKMAESVYAEIERRAALFESAPGYPVTLDAYNDVAGEYLPRWVAIFDEFNATLKSAGRAFENAIGEIARQGRKFGIHAVFAAQEFSMNEVGAVRNQIRTVICHSVGSAQTARNVGCAGAEKITAKGRAVTNRWGVVQTYYLDRDRLIEYADGLGHDAEPALAPHTPVLSPDEIAMVRWAIDENDGYLGWEDIKAQTDLSNNKSKQLGVDWEDRGWLEKDPDNNNKRRITALLQDLI